MSKDRWKRREKKKLNKRKHKVIGKSVLLLQKIIGERANKIINNRARDKEQAKRPLC